MQLTNVCFLSYSEVQYTCLDQERVSEYLKLPVVWRLCEMTMLSSKKEEARQLKQYEARKKKILDDPGIRDNLDSLKETFSGMGMGPRCLDRYEGH